MNTRTRASFAWAASILVHAMLFVIVLAGGGGASAGLDLYEVGLADMPGRPQAATVPAKGDPAAAKPDAQTEPDQTAVPTARANEPKVQGEKRPVHVDPIVSSRSKGVPQGTSTQPPADLPGKSTAVPATGGGPGGSQGQGRGEGPGSGDGFVLSRPVYYPKNVQNEGKEGTVRVAVTLSQDGIPSAVLVSSSGDDRLDRYALRAVTEAWQYTRPAQAVRIFVSLVFSNGKVEVVFEKSEYLNGGGETP